MTDNNRTVLKETMAKKSKRAKLKTSSSSQHALVATWMNQANSQVLKGNYVAAIDTCQRVLHYLPQKAPQRAEMLDYLGTAQGMLQNFPEAYEAYTEALSLTPGDAQVWYNRGMACRFTIRSGQSVHDFEQAVALNRNPALAKQFAEALTVSRTLAEMSLQIRGSDFTLDQLIEQEEHFQRGLTLMIANKWEEASEAFQHSIEMRDCLPQPWGNLGISFMMQERYDEAERALKRALEIDPKYTLAKENLAALPEIRRIGPPDIIEISDPFKGTKLKQGLLLFRKSNEHQKRTT
jgi:tetratricopeptide (TPR) repeat protein